jgi:hypothetical protein
LNFNASEEALDLFVSKQTHKTILYKKNVIMFNNDRTNSTLLAAFRFKESKINAIRINLTFRTIKEVDTQ